MEDLHLRGGKARAVKGEERGCGSLSRFPSAIQMFAVSLQFNWTERHLLWKEKTKLNLYEHV